MDRQKRTDRKTTPPRHRFFRGFPVREAWGGPGRGRCVVSARPIKRGEVVLEALPYALAPKLVHLTCSRCFCYTPPCTDAGGAEEEDDRSAVSRIHGDGHAPERGHHQQGEASVRRQLRPCSGGCGVAFYCSAEEEAEDWNAGHRLECTGWGRVHAVAGSMSLTESEQTELRLVLRIVARHHQREADDRFVDDDGSDEESDGQEGNGESAIDGPATKKTETRLTAANSKPGKVLATPAYNDVLRLCSNMERRPLEEVTFWRRVVQRIMAPLAEGEPAGKEAVPWSRYDLVELIGKNLCNGFGLRGHPGGECYAYGIYPGASYFNHSCYPNVCRLDQDGQQLGVGRSSPDQSIRFVALVDIPQGHQVTLSYIDASKPTDHRRLALSAIYFFHCVCTRCEGTKGPGHKGRRGSPARKDDYVRRFVCRSCTKTNGRGVLYPFSPSHDRCNLCRRLVARDNRPA